MEKKITSDSKTVFYLSGIINETTDFSSIFEDLSAQNTIDFRGITRINSVGAKGWIKYFNSLKEYGFQLTFQALSVCLVEQANNVRNFTCGFTVTSICVPYFCEEFNKTCVHIHDVGFLNSCVFNPPDIKCDHSKGLCIFDDLPEHYFAFLRRE